jgi:phage gp36-like protein
VYIALADIQKVLEERVLIGLTAAQGESVVNQEKVDATILRACSKIDNILSVGHDVPLAAAPQIVKDACVDITIYLLHHKPNDHRRSLYEDALGDMRLYSRNAPGTSSTKAAASLPTSTTVGAEEHVFTDTSMETW